MEILGGPMFGVAGSGESHGPAITTIVFGCPPGLELTRREIQSYLDRRRPGSSKHGTARREADRVILLSGLYQDDYESLLSGPTITVEGGPGGFSARSYEKGVTTGEPIGAIVLSTSKKSHHYEQFKGPRGAVRPGHTDLVKFHKAGGHIDVRGGGRSSYRSTISDVIGGSVARIYLARRFGTRILSSISQVGPLRAEESLARQFEQLARESKSRTVEVAQIDDLERRLEKAEIASLDADFARKAAELIRRTRIEGDSLGACVEVVAVNVPPLLGEPLYNSLKLRLMGTFGGLHAAQSCEIGDGVEVVSRRGSENNDPIRRSGYRTNSHGGLIGGVTTGNPVVCRVGFKPTSSIPKKQQSVRKYLEEIDFQLESGRHDPCVGVRAGITLESRLAIEVMNAAMVHQASRTDLSDWSLF